MSSLVSRRTANSYTSTAAQVAELNAKFEADLHRSRGRAREVCYDIPSVSHDGCEFSTLSNQGAVWFLGRGDEDKFILSTANISPFALALVYHALAHELAPAARPASAKDDASAEPVAAVPEAESEGTAEDPPEAAAVEAPAVPAIAEPVVAPVGAVAVAPKPVTPEVTEPHAATKAEPRRAPVKVADMPPAKSVSAKAECETEF